MVAISAVTPNTVKDLTAHFLSDQAKKLIGDDDDLKNKSLSMTHGAFFRATTPISIDAFSKSEYKKEMREIEVMMLPNEWRKSMLKRTDYDTVSNNVELKRVFKLLIGFQYRVNEVRCGCVCG